MIGLRGGIAGGMRGGAAPGIVRDPIAPIPYPVDALSGKAYPLTVIDWYHVLDAAQVARRDVLHSHPCQDAAGNPAATVGTAYTAAGSLEYGVAVAGSARKGIRISETAAERFGWGLGVGPDPGAGPVLFLADLVQGTITGATRNMMSCTLLATNFTAQARNTGVFRVIVDGVATDGVIAHEGIHYRLALLWSRTAAIATGYSTLERVVGTYSANVADGNKGHGTTGTSAVETVLWDSWFGDEWTEAELRRVMAVLENRAMPW